MEDNHSSLRRGAVDAALTVLSYLLLALSPSRWTDPLASRMYLCYISSPDTTMAALPKTKLLDEPGDRMIHVRLSADTHRLLRIRVAALDTNIQDWVAALIEAALEREPVEVGPSRGKKSWQRTLSRR